jgi:transcriptional regulator with XRE-family HTH domain
MACRFLLVAANLCHMRGRTVNGARLQLLREEADLHRTRLAEELGCSPGHLKNVELCTPPGSPSQLSGQLVFRTAKILSAALDREVPIDEFTDLTGVEDERAAS